MQQLCPQLFGGVDLATAPQEAFAELRRAHVRLMEAHARVSGVWKKWDDDFYDYNKDGESHTTRTNVGRHTTTTSMPFAARLAIIKVPQGRRAMAVAARSSEQVGPGG